MPKISVVIPVYNVEEYLKECIDSVLQQTYCDYEIIAVNDGSTDNSADILSEYASINPCFKVITTVNQGLSMARNAGIDSAAGDYIIFLDSDDKLSENTFETCLKHLELKKLDAVFFGSEVIIDGVDESLKEQFNYKRPSVLIDKVITGQEFFTESISSSKYIVSACMYMVSRESIGELRFYPGIFHEDNLFTTNLLLSGRLRRVICLREKFFQRRLRPSSIMTQDKSTKHIDGYLICAEKLLGLLNNSDNNKTIEALNFYICSLIRSGLNVSFEVYRGRLPFRYRILILWIFMKGKIFDYRLLIRTLSPHFYLVLNKIRCAK